MINFITNYNESGVRGLVHEEWPSEHCSSRLGTTRRVVGLAKGDMMGVGAGGAHTGNTVRRSKYMFAPRDVKLVFIHVCVARCRIC